MNRTTRFLVFLMVLLALLVPVVSVQAQDEPEVTPEIIVAPDENPSVIVVPVPNIPPIDNAETGETPIKTIWDVVGVIAVFFGGLTLTGAGIVVAVVRLRKNPEQMTILENAFNSVPRDVLQTLQDLSRVAIDAANVAKEIAVLLKEATDGVPVKTKPPFTFAMTDKDGNTQIVYYDTGEALLGQTGRFQQHEDGTLTWHPDAEQG